MKREVLSRTVALRARKFAVEEIRVGPGEQGLRHIIRHPGAAVILPLREVETGEGTMQRIVAIRNFRVAPGVELLELPAGTLEPPEAPEVTAARELEEETGYSAATLRLLGRFYTTPGMTDELMWAYVATGLTPIGQRLEPDEDIRVEEFSPRGLLDAMDRGELVDGKSMLCLLLALRLGLFGDESRAGGGGGR